MSARIRGRDLLATNEGEKERVEVRVEPSRHRRGDLTTVVYRVASHLIARSICAIRPRREGQEYINTIGFWSIIEYKG